VAVTFTAVDGRSAALSELFVMAENYRVAAVSTTKKRQALALGAKHARSAPVILSIQCNL